MQGEADAQQQTALETELRRAKRREEKLTGMLWRLREDAKDPAAFDNLRSVRDLEYDLDFVAGRSHREKQVSSVDVVDRRQDV